VTELNEKPPAKCGPWRMRITPRDSIAKWPVNY
jgi:hypothetical protein